MGVRLSHTNMDANPGYNMEPTVTRHVTTKPEKLRKLGDSQNYAAEIGHFSGAECVLGARSNTL